MAMMTANFSYVSANQIYPHVHTAGTLAMKSLGLETWQENQSDFSWISNEGRIISREWIAAKRLTPNDRERKLVEKFQNALSAVQTSGSLDTLYDMNKALTEIADYIYGSYPVPTDGDPEYVKAKESISSEEVEKSVEETERKLNEPK